MRINKICLSGLRRLFFVYLILAWSTSAYCTHEGGSPHTTTDTTTATSGQIPASGTTPNTQSTANMDSTNMMRSNDEFLISPSDLDISDRLTHEAEWRLYEHASKEVEAKERLGKEKVAEEKFQKWLSEPSSSKDEAERKESAKQFREEEKRRKEEWKEFNLKMSEELGSAWDPIAGKVNPPPLPELKSEPPKPLLPTTPSQPQEDDLDFLPDFEPGVSVYENMPVTPVAPEAAPSPQKGQAPADGKSGGSGSTQKDDIGPDLIVY